ncbi:MAG: Rrf2 family transcriptional regulator [Flavobacteriaceae bacterium]|nr:Rrf2 family transcriptional regulator [Flavobacteriaceae bacterium]
MLSNASKYALRAILFLANNATEDNKLSAKILSEEIKVPKPFLSKILQQLATKSFVTSIKGPNGGFYISEDQMEANLLSVIIEVEGKDRFNQCALNIDNCNLENPCSLHKYIAPSKEALRDSFSRVRVEDLHESMLA